MPAEFSLRPALPADAAWIAELRAGVLRRVMDDSKDHRPFRLNVLQGSPARRLYERHGFVLETEDPVDVFMVAASPS